ncbi:MAG: hypothetical protein ACREV7_21810 [Steroidobacteraceae bacterium]
MLARLHSIKESLAEESDPEERERTLKLLKNAQRKLTAHRESLEALRVDPNAGPELEEQIQLIGMLEDECRVDGDGTRPV